MLFPYRLLIEHPHAHDTILQWLEQEIDQAHCQASDGLHPISKSVERRVANLPRLSATSVRSASHVLPRPALSGRRPKACSSRKQPKQIHL